MKWLQKVTGGYSSSAKVVDGTLILSLPDAVAPVVWRMELGSVRSSALEVREREDGLFVLTLKTPKGDVSDVAPFSERGRALRALMAVSDAMAHAHGEIRPAAAANDAGGGPAAAPAPRRRARGSNLAAGIVGLVVLAFLLFMLARLAPNPAGMQMPAAAEGGASAVGGGSPADATGVPVSADDFLLKRE
jgi:hypothetical protein